MKKIESFLVNHLKLYKGLYLSRKDVIDGVTISTFDLRMTAPNRDEPIDVKALHTIEHLFATYLRNSSSQDKIIYFGPMGCRTGCYLVMGGDLLPKDVYSLVVECCDFVISFKGRIPGATKKGCGNYSEQNLPLAKKYIKNYKEELCKYKRFTYAK